MASGVTSASLRVYGIDVGAHEMIAAVVGARGGVDTILTENGERTFPHSVTYRTGASRVFGHFSAALWSACCTLSSEVLRAPVQGVVDPACLPAAPSAGPALQVLPYALPPPLSGEHPPENAMLACGPSYVMQLGDGKPASVAAVSVMAALLAHIRKSAASFFTRETGQTVVASDVVLCIPPLMPPVARSRLLASAGGVGLKVHALLPSVVCVAVSFGYERAAAVIADAADVLKKDDTPSASTRRVELESGGSVAQAAEVVANATRAAALGGVVYVGFVDFGHTHTTAAVASYTATSTTILSIASLPVGGRAATLALCSEAVEAQTNPAGYPPTGVAAAAASALSLRSQVPKWSPSEGVVCGNVEVGGRGVGIDGRALGTLKEGVHPRGRAVARLVNEVERAKRIVACTSGSAAIRIENAVARADVADEDDCDFVTTVTPQLFDAAVEPVSCAVESVCAAAFAAAGRPYLSSVEVVGGGARIRTFRSAASRGFEVDQVSDRMVPTESAARGAAVVGALLNPRYRVNYSYSSSIVPQYFYAAAASTAPPEVAVHCTGSSAATAAAAAAGSAKPPTTAAPVAVPGDSFPIVLRFPAVESESLFVSLYTPSRVATTEATRSYPRVLPSALMGTLPTPPMTDAVAPSARASAASKDPKEDGAADAEGGDGDADVGAAAAGVAAVPSGPQVLDLSVETVARLDALDQHARHAAAAAAAGDEKLVHYEGWCVSGLRPPSASGESEGAAAPVDVEVVVDVGANGLMIASATITARRPVVEGGDAEGEEGEEGEVEARAGVVFRCLPVIPPSSRGNLPTSSLSVGCASAAVSAAFDDDAASAPHVPGAETERYSLHAVEFEGSLAFERMAREIGMIEKEYDGLDVCYSRAHTALNDLWTRVGAARTATPLGFSEKVSNIVEEGIAEAVTTAEVLQAEVDSGPFETPAAAAELTRRAQRAISALQAVLDAAMDATRLHTATAKAKGEAEAAAAAAAAAVPRRVSVPSEPVAMLPPPPPAPHAAHLVASYSECCESAGVKPAAAVVSTLMQDGANVRTLDLSSERIGSRGALALAEFLGRHASLPPLPRYDSDGRVLPVEIDPSCANVVTLPQLTCLDLSDNSIVDRCVPPVCRGLRRVPLQRLSLRNNPGVMTCGGRALCELAHVSTHLRECDVEGTSILGTTRRTIVKQLDANKR